MRFILICVGMFHIFLNIFDIFIYMFDMLIDISICLLMYIPQTVLALGVLTDLLETRWSPGGAGSRKVASQNLGKHNVFGTGG